MQAMDRPFDFPLFHGKMQMIARNDQSIKKLRISRKELSKDAFRTFCHMLHQNKYLEDLWIDGSHLELDTAFALASAINQNKSLRVLRLRNIRFGCPTATKAILDVVTTSTTLEELYLEGNDLNANDGPLLGLLARNNKSLRILHIENNHIGNKGVAALAVGLQSNTTLTDLALHNVGATYVVGYELTDLIIHNTKLKLLHLIDNPDIPPAALCRFFKQLEHNDSLAFLVLKGNRVDLPAAHAVSQVLLRNTTLQKLVLWGNGINNDAATVIAHGIRHNDTITEVRFQMNRIGDKGAVALADALATHESIQIMDLTFNPIHAVGGKALAQALYKNKLVESINLYRTHVPNLEEIDGLLRLNRAGRRLFSDPTVLAGIWPQVLARVNCQPDLINLLLKENPSIIPSSF